MFSFNSWHSGTAALMAVAITASATATIVTPAPAFAQYDRYPDRSEQYPDRSEQYPDRSEQYPDRSEQYPDRSEQYPSRSDQYPDRSEQYPDRSEQYPSRYEDQSQVSIPAGTRIPVQYDKSQKIVVTPDETTPVTLRVATDITNRNGTILIPAGTQVVGQLEPAQRRDEKGSRFVARELVFNSDRRQDIDAASRVVTRTERVTKTNSGNILKGAAAGGAAATVLSAISGGGRVPLGAVLGGAGAGAVGGLLLGRSHADVVVIYPDRDLNLTLDSDLPVRYSGR